MTDSIFRSYEEFLARVKDGRKMSDEKLRPLADGKVWSGREALAHGLVDSLGGFPEALLKAQELSNMPQDVRGPYVVIKMPARAGLLPEPWKDAAEAVSPLLTPRMWALLPWDF
jgi:protease-4